MTTGSQSRVTAATGFPLRPDVFLSYSRSDELFVRRLTSSLEARGKDIWVDLSDIRKGADWRARVQAGVESARVVVPVLSPAFARSDACAEEIEHAVEHNKRLVPVVRRSVEHGSLRAELTAPNWIFFDDDERFEAGVEELVEAAEADLGWLDEHARLLVRALEWKRADDRTKSSLLLRGGDLRAAENWLAAQADHRERATPEQVDYIVASRRSATRRQQITFGAVALALAVSVALTIFALVKRSQAIHQSKLAGSRELAIASTAALNEDPELGLLLAMRAVGKAPTPEATTALRTALDESRVRTRLHHGGAVKSAVYSPDGRAVLTASEDGTARLWRGRDGRLLAALRPHNDVETAAFSPDGRQVVTSSEINDAGYVEIWNVRTQQRLGRWTHADFGADAIYSPDGRSILTLSFLGAADLWRFDGGWHFVHRFGRRPLMVESAEFSADGRRLLTTISDLDADPGSPSANFARIWNTRTGEAVLDFRGKDALGKSARFSPDGRFVITTSFDRFARIWDAANGRRVADLVGHQDGLNDARFSADGRLIVTASQDGTARVWDARAARQLLVLRGHANPVATASFSANGQRVITAGADGTARIWEVRGILPPRIPGSITPRTIALSADATVAAVGGMQRATVWNVRRRRQIGTIELLIRSPVEVVVSPNGRYVFALNSGTGEAKLWDVRRRRSIGDFLHVRGLDSYPFSADGTRLVVRKEDGFGVWDVGGKRFVLRKPDPAGDSFAVATLSPNGRTAVTGQLGSAWAWDVGTGRGRRLFSVGRLDFVELALFSPDGSRLVAGSGDAPVLWDFARRRRTRTLHGHTSAISHFSFSRDGDRILTAADDETARLWDGHTGAPIAVIRAHTEDVTSAILSADGSLIATTSGDDAIRIADGRTGEPVAVARTGRGGVFSAAFIGDTTQLVATHAGGTPWLERCTLCAPLDDLLALARRRVTRDLTRAEREKYLHE